MDNEFPYNFRHHPEIAGLLGGIAATWAGIEFQMSHLFTWMIGCSPLHGSAAYFQISSNKARIDMIRGLKQYLHSDKEREIVAKIIDLVISSGKIRNRHLHSPYMLHDGDVYQLSNIGVRYPHGFKKVIDQKTIWKDLCEISNTSNNLGKSISDLTKTRPLILRKETVPESLQQKFHELHGFENPNCPQKNNDQ